MTPDKFPTMSPAMLAQIAARKAQPWPSNESQYYVTKAREQQNQQKAKPYAFAHTAWGVGPK
jgi:hypothetical protein